LSSLATAGLIAWATPLTAWFESRGGGRGPRWLTESLGVSLAAQAATLPIILVSFGRLAVLSPVVNLVVVPLVAPAMAAGIFALAGGAVLAGGAPAILGAVVAAPGWVILRILVLVVETAAGLPFASVTLVPPFDVIAAGVAVVCLVAVTWWRRRRRVDPAIERAGGPPVAPSSKTATNAPHDTARGASRAAAAGLIVAVAVAGSVVAAR